MEKGFSFISSPSPCAYLKDQKWSLEHRFIPDLSREEFQRYLNEGWRRFGSVIFRPRCQTCTACLSLRVLVDQFRPDRSQRRTMKANANIELVIGEPCLDEARITLYFLHHQLRHEMRGWQRPRPDTALQLIYSIAEGTLPAEEWSYYIDGKLVGVSYIDALPEGYSAIYSYHHPEYQKRSLGTYMVLRLIEEAQKREMPYVYLGYYVEHCLSLEYKARFAPNEVLDANGNWSTFVA